MLVTANLGPCIGLAIHNPVTKSIGLAHIDDSCTKESIINLISQMRSSENQILKLYLTGGNHVDVGSEGGKAYFVPILKEIYSKPNVQVVEDFTFREGKEDYEADFLAIDTDGYVLYSDKYIPIEYETIKYMKNGMHDIVVVGCAGLDYGEYSKDNGEIPDGISPECIVM